MSEDDAIGLLLGLGGLVLVVAAPAAILAVAAFSQARASGEGPKPTGGRGVLVALAGHGLGVVTGLLAVFGIAGCFVFLDGSPSGLERLGAYALVGLVAGGLLLAPSLFLVGLAIARGGGTKTRAGVLGVAAWVALHHALATGTLLLLASGQRDAGVFLLCLVPAPVGFLHAAAMTWVGLARIGEPNAV